MFKNKIKKYFSLLELIMVIVVITLLVGMSLPKFTGIKKDAKVSALQQDLDTITKIISIKDQDELQDLYIKKDISNENSYFVLKTGNTLDQTLRTNKDTNLTKIKVLDTNKLNKEIQSLRYGEYINSSDKYLYSEKTNIVYYEKGLINSKGETIHCLEKNKSDLNNNLIVDKDKYNTYLYDLEHFIDNYMTFDNGIIQKYTLQENSNIYTKPQALMCLYAVYKGDEERFEKFYNILNTKINNKNLLLYITDINNIPLNNDNNIESSYYYIKSLLLAYDKFGNEKYKDTALKLGNALKKYCVDENYNPLGFYQDWMGTTYKNKNIYISELDLQTMYLLGKYDDDWYKIYEQSLKIIKQSYISDTIPLYKDNYNYDTGFENTNQIDMEKCLKTTLNLSTSNEDITPVMNWLRDNVKNNKKIVAFYNLDGTPIKEYEYNTTPTINCLLIQICQQEEALDLIDYFKNDIIEAQANDFGWNQCSPNDIRYGSFCDISSNSETWDNQNMYPLLAYLYIKP